MVGGKLGVGKLVADRVVAGNDTLYARVAAIVESNGKRKCILNLLVYA